MGTSSMAVSTMIAGFFGMNLASGWEDSRGKRRKPKQPVARWGINGSARFANFLDFLKVHAV